MRLTRDGRLLQTFARLADTLVDDYDVVELLQVLVDTCRDVLEMTAAGILLAGPQGELDLVASTSETRSFAEMMQLGSDDGPCLECYRTGRHVAVPDLAASSPAWVQFRASARRQGFRALDSLPLRLRDTSVGTLSLLRSSAGDAPAEDIVAAQAFADVATIGILHERAIRESSILSEQLQAALNSRVVIEQAKGVVAHTRGVPIDEAFTFMRQYARAHQLRLGLVAAQIVERRIEL
ncbi:GAF and ANTAR domain-containing protein [Microbacterium sp. zg.B48]|uniref:GAF and ANTAR domain-containing protein n=1 Tax=Microbacterium sp. zg.B48 TaxID=2969408 RepID=UPI00214B8178|nr:GAF and ANTAR domain-containing protein [Microbacterium sp. zg.B48]MCR2763138.1 GAF and ANTAR domain-containing protein [Microbacterium sp. zg.B48]